MKQHFLRAMLLALPLLGFLHVSAQNKTDKFATKYKNTFLVGINLATNGTGNQRSYFYRNEYIRRVNRFFEAGLGLGFFNYQHHPSTLYSSGYGNHEHYEKLSQTSIVSLDIIGYFDIINSRRSLLKLGFGYSTRFVNAISPQATFWYYNEFLKKTLFYTQYLTEKGIDGGLIIHLEYGYRITPHFASSFSLRFYSEGKYVSLSMAGINFSYLF